MKFLGLVYFWIAKQKKEEAENGEEENTDHKNNGWTEQTGEKQGICMNKFISNPKKLMEILNAFILIHSSKAELCLHVSTDGVTRIQIRNMSQWFYYCFRGNCYL